MPATREGIIQTIPTRLGPLSVTCHGAGGPAAVLWHSLFLDGRSFDSVLPELTRERAVFVVDGPGHGSSPGPDTPYNLDDCASAASEVLDHLGQDRVDWVGNAWGGHVGVALAARVPSRVRSLAVVCSPMQPLRGVARLRIAALVSVFAAVGWRPWLLEAVQGALLLPAARKKHPELDAYVADAAMAPGRERTLRAMKAVMLGRGCLVDQLSAIEAPTLFVTSPDDPLWLPELASSQASHLRRGRVAVLTGTRHVPSLESPEAFRRLLSDWLGSVSVTPGVASN